KSLEANPPEQPTLDSSSLGSGYQLRLSFFKLPPTFKTLDTISNSFLSRIELKNYSSKIRRVYSFNDVDYGSMERPDYDMLSVYFKDLDSVRAFAKFVYADFN